MRKSIDDLFFTLLLKNTPAFFMRGNSNLLTGADTAFGPDSLTDGQDDVPQTEGWSRRQTEGSKADQHSARVPGRAG